MASCETIRASAKEVINLMLAINRSPFYKNKLLLSSLAVFAGFFVTVGIIRAIDPVNDSTSQSTQTNSDRRASSLIPINASDAEKSSESQNDKNDSNTSSDTAATGSGSATPAGSSTWIAPAPSSSGSGASPRTATSSGTASSSTTSPTQSSTPTSSSTSQTTPTSPQPAPTKTQTCVLDMLGVQLICS